ncbi:MULTISPECIES: O-antigen ligase family protein [Hyphobacterium]|uniref:O-antigen ligase n=1 Tax=Hyphobacterium vulgare TaxID=1736751 RepID=A0ABV6ZTP6_9PROT
MSFVAGTIGRLRQAPRLGVLEPLEAGATILVFLLMSQALLGPLLTSETDPDGPVLLRVMWLPVYALGLVWLVSRPMQGLKSVSRAPLMLVLALMCMASALWSLDPGLSMRRGFAVVMSVLFGFAVAARWDWKQLITLLAITYAILAFGSLLAVVAAPSFGIQQDIHVGAWRGLWGEKNTLGAIMSYGASASLGAAAVMPRRKLFWWCVAGLQAGLVLMSTSKTGLLALLLVVGGATGIALVRRGFGFAALMIFALLLGGSLGALILTMAPVEFLEMLGRDATLTGRTDIWEVLVGQVFDRPWTGYGYGAFWTVENGPVFWVRQATNWPVPTAHNGWLEVALAIGLPGLAILVLVYLGTVGRAAGRLFRGREVYFLLTFFAVVTTVSISESNLLHRNSLMWVVFVAAASKLAVREDRV